jgi:hypothetical protein
MTPAKKSGKTVNNWNVTSVRSVIMCWKCAKPCCIFTKLELSPDEQSSLQQRIEAKQYVGGSALFDDSEELVGKTIVQQIAIDCSREIEKLYNSPPEKGKSLVLEDLCIHSGDSGGLLSQDEMRTKGLTDGHDLYQYVAFALQLAGNQ